MSQNKKRGSQETQAAVRVLVVAYLKGHQTRGSIKEAAKLYQLSTKAVGLIWKRYKTGGAKSLQSKKRGVQEGKKISAAVIREIKKIITDKTPDQLKFKFALWTVDAVRMMIEKKFSIKLSKVQVWRYLKA